MTKIFAALTAASIALTSSLALAAAGDVAPVGQQPAPKPAVTGPAVTQTAPVKAGEQGKTDAKPAEVKKEEKKS